MVPLPSNAIVPERDVDKTPILETHHLGIDFGGLTAVDDFSLIVGRTEIAGLIGPNGAGKTTVFNLLTNVYQPRLYTVRRQADCRKINLPDKQNGNCPYLSEYTPVCRNVGYRQCESRPS